MLRSSSFAAIAPLLLGSACASVPIGASRGEIVVFTNTGEVHVRAIEIQHQDYTHAESISGFESGQSTVRKEVIAGHYCVERMITYEVGAVAGGVSPQNLCFEVVPGEVTEIHVGRGSSGRIGIAVPHAKPLANPDPPLAGAD